MSTGPIDLSMCSIVVKVVHLQYHCVPSLAALLCMYKTVLKSIPPRNNGFEYSPMKTTQWNIKHGSLLCKNILVHIVDN